MSYLRYLCLFVQSGDQQILCCVFVLFFYVLIKLSKIFLLSGYVDSMLKPLALMRYVRENK
jgi:hypothetical protein